MASSANACALTPVRRVGFGLCRLCQANPSSIPLHAGEKNIGTHLSALIHRHLPVRINVWDLSYPLTICSQCATTLMDFGRLFCKSIQVDVNLQMQRYHEMSLRIPDDADELEQPDPPPDLHMPVTIQEFFSDNPHIAAPKELPPQYIPDSTALKSPRASSITPTTCHICNKTFRSKDYLRRHIIIHSKIRLHKCRLCQSSFKRIDHLTNHEKTKHSEHPDILRAHESMGGRKYVCAHCGIVKLTKHLLKNHMKKHTRVIRCQFCSEESQCFLSYRKHLMDAHKKVRFRCGTCSKVTYTGIGFYKHKSIHSKKHSCMVCKKTFAFKSSLTKHMISHSKLKAFECSICSKRFKLKSQLVAHTKRHDDSRPFSCDICHKSFKTKEALKVHKRTHDNRRPFPCSHCNFRAKTKSTLLGHVITHSAVKRFKCNICDKQFAQKSSWYRHRRVIHDIHV